MHTEGIPHHIGINYVITPVPVTNKAQAITFQQALVNAGIDFNTADDSNGITITRREPPLVIKVTPIPNAPVGQLLMVAPRPQRTPEEFGKEAEAIAAAFMATWTNTRQIVTCDATIRYLYQTTSEHAFKELWEGRLGQSASSLQRFGRGIAGGGLRLVMTPPADKPDAAHIEIKVESFLEDARQFFIEAIFRWPVPQTGAPTFDTAQRLTNVDRFIEDELIPFITERDDDHHHQD